MAKSIYTIRTINGSEVIYTYKDMLDICKQYLEKTEGKILPTKQECEAIMDWFAEHKLFDDNKGRVYI